MKPAQTFSGSDLAITLGGTRREHDFVGDKDIPVTVYGGVYSARAVENFPITGQAVGGWSDLGCVLAFVKRASARAKANTKVLARRIAEPVTRVTALNPVIGYEKVAMIAKTALATGGTIAHTADSLGIMTRAEMEALLVPDMLTHPVRLVA